MAPNSNPFLNTRRLPPQANITQNVARGDRLTNPMPVMNGLMPQNEQISRRTNQTVNLRPIATLQQQQQQPRQDFPNVRYGQMSAEQGNQFQRLPPQVYMNHMRHLANQQQQFQHQQAYLDFLERSQSSARATADREMHRNRLTGGRMMTNHPPPSYFETMTNSNQNSKYVSLEGSNICELDHFDHFLTTSFMTGLSEHL